MEEMPAETPLSFWMKAKVQESMALLEDLEGQKFQDSIRVARSHPFGLWSPYFQVRKFPGRSSLSHFIVVG